MLRASVSADVRLVPVVKGNPGSSDGQPVALAKVFRRLDQGPLQPQPVPFDIRERRNVARILRRARLRNLVGTVMVMIMLACGLVALTAVRLSGDPNYVKPW